MSYAKTFFGFASEAVGSAVGGILGGYAGVGTGFEIGSEFHKRVWVDPNSWQGKKFGSAPFNVVGSAPSISGVRVVGSAGRVTGSAPSKSIEYVQPKPVVKPIYKPIYNKPFVKKHHRGIKVGKYYRKSFY